MTSAIGIMQGRLVPPVGDRIQCFPQERWREEFARAAAAGLVAIEWIFDLDDAAMNPLATDEGFDEVRRLSAEHRVAVDSVCADYFMARPLVRATPGERAERLATLEWLLGRCAACGLTRVVLPFVDASKIATDTDRDDVVSALGQVLHGLERNGLEIHLETSLPPAEFRRLLDRVPDRRILVNYDSGNSASLGFDPREEWAAYGDRVGSVHIKDRILGGGTVPLGTGNADFPALFSAIRRAAYDGPWILQVARGTPGDEVAWARENRAFLAGSLEGRR
jgi:L-ribulose-5-phosphate 3-epimerase